LLPLSVVLADGGVKGVVVGHVGGEAPDLVLLNGYLDDGGELLSGKREVVVPPEPTAVGGVDIQVHVLKLQLRDSMGDALAEDLGGVSAELDAHVGDEVTQGVGLENDGELEIRGRLDLINVGLDELLMVALKAVLGRLELTSGLAGGAVAVGKVVEDEADDLLLFDLLLGLARGLDGVVDAGQLRDTAGLGYHGQGDASWIWLPRTTNCP